MHSKRKTCTSFVLYLKVFKNHLYYLWHVIVLSIKPCLHTQLPEHNKSYRKVSRGWGYLITWNGPMMGHLNSFSASGGGNLNKNFPKIQMSRGLPRGGFWSFDLTGTLLWSWWDPSNTGRALFWNCVTDFEAPHRPFYFLRDRKSMQAVMFTHLHKTFWLISVGETTLM